MRDYLYESSADWFTDDQLNRLIAEEIRSLPAKDIYLEEIHETNLVSGQMDYTLPSNCMEVEKIERNVGTTSDPVWDDLTGWDIYGGAIYLTWKPDTNDEIRAFIRCNFTVPTDDVNELDVPDEVCEIVVWGVVVRAYKMVIGYLRQAKNWDAVGKSDAPNITSVQSWLQEAKRDYLDLIKSYATTPRPRDIDLSS